LLETAAAQAKLARRLGVETRLGCERAAELESCKTAHAEQMAAAMQLQKQQLADALAVNKKEHAAELEERCMQTESELREEYQQKQILEDESAVANMQKLVRVQVQLIAHSRSMACGLANMKHAHAAARDHS
jgi:hypothetical protein